ncbi:MAG: epoxide hydrolase family protein [Pseudomonadota bacterium]
MREFKIDVPEAEIDDLRRRLAATRWPEKEPVDNWSQGAPLALVKEFCAYWEHDHDWRAVERELNAAAGGLVEIDGLDIHFLHVRSPHAEATPLLLAHGWPGSVVEFLDAIPRLTDPTAHGGSAEDAFHVIALAMPGYGFSGKPAETGWGLERFADVFAALMARLGYAEYLAQGGDWGSEVVMLLLDRHPKACLGAHLNLVSCRPPKEVLENPTEYEAGELARLAKYQKRERGYMIQQGTKPQTLGYGLVDSPAGQAAWIYEKFLTWSDGAVKRPEEAFNRDRLLDNIALYWFTASAASSARLYWESIRSSGRQDVLGPVACSIFPGEIQRPTRRWAESRFKTIRHWSTPKKGGHFAALEQPEIFVDEVRAAGRVLWPS